MNGQDIRRLEELEKTLRTLEPGLELRKSEPMRQHTSFQIGGPAALMVLPHTKQEAQFVLQTASEYGIAPFFLGNGSNLLVSDTGYPGLVVKLSGTFSQIQEVNRPLTHLTAGSAVLLSSLAAAAMNRGLTGLEFASGIPGTLGGAVMMNAGAYGGEMAQVVTSVTFLKEDGTQQTVSASQCGFTYRHSVFTEHPGWLITSVELSLQPGDRAEIQRTMTELGEKRRAKQPLNQPSAGSTFKRPAGHFAAALIETCGCKGLSVGGAKVSEKHAGFIVNTGNASCADVFALIAEVKRRVFAQTGVMLELEIKTLGV